MEEIKINSYDKYQIIKFLGAMIFIIIILNIIAVVIFKSIYIFVSIFIPIVIIGFIFLGLISIVIEREVILFNNEKIEIYFGKSLYLSIRWKEIRNIEIIHEKFGVYFHGKYLLQSYKICDTINFKIYLDSKKFEYRLFWNNFPSYKQELILKTLKEFLIKNSIPFDETHNVELSVSYSSDFISSQHKQLKDSIRYKSEYRCLRGS